MRNKIISIYFQIGVNIIGIPESICHKIYANKNASINVFSKFHK